MATREENGKMIARIEGSVRRVDAHTYLVASQSGQGAYDVLGSDIGWICSCPDHIWRGVKCKHIFAVEFSFAFRQEVSVNRIESIVDPSKCVLCGSIEVVKDGVRHNQHGDIQIFNCKACGHYFTFNFGFEHMRASPQVITSAMQLYFTGESLRNVRKFLRLQGVNKSHVSIYRWIRKYVRLMEKYFESIKPQVSGTWRADEMYLKVKGNLKYLFALMDDQTRFWIAQEVADSKERHDVRRLFHEGKEVTGMRPKTLITDGLGSYHIAYLKEFWTHRNPRTRHIRHIRIQGDKNNNRMERMNGEIRDREKVMRGLKVKQTPILKGYQLFHNYIRTHEALDGKTPAEAAGIQVQGENKWMTLIQNAAVRRNLTDRKSDNP